MRPPEPNDYTAYLWEHLCYTDPAAAFTLPLCGYRLKSCPMHLHLCLYFGVVVAVRGAYPHAVLSCFILSHIILSCPHPALSCPHPILSRPHPILSASSPVLFCPHPFFILSCLSSSCLVLIRPCPALSCPHKTRPLCHGIHEHPAATGRLTVKVPAL